MSKGPSYLALLLLVIISTVIIPKEFIHALCDHEDTPANICEHHHKGIHVEPAHHECELLKFQVLPFFVSLTQFDLCIEVTRLNFQLPVTETLCGDNYNLSRLRGPPSCQG